MANEAIPFYEDADELPCVANGAVTGKKLVQVNGAREGTISGSGIDVGLDTTASGGRIKVSAPNTAGAAGAAKSVLGVAAWDAADGVEVTVLRRKVVPVTCGANITAGQEVEAMADGRVTPLAAGVAIGVAVDTTASGGDAQIALYR